MNNKDNGKSKIRGEVTTDTIKIANWLIRLLSQPYLDLARLEKSLKAVCPSNPIVQFT
jgi:hypothetical protein